MNAMLSLLIIVPIMQRVITAYDETQTGLIERVKFQFG